MTRTLLLGLVAALMIVPLAGAHTSVKPRENEVHILQDFADDISYEVGSWDLWDIYFGEASIPGLGDGVYFHTILFGSYAKRMPGETEFRATFTFQGPGGAVTRSLSTKDGKTLTGDFDHLDTKPIGNTDIEVVRAFIANSKSGLAPGAEVKGWKVETFVDTDLRDRAPGGYFVPKSGGRIEKPETSVVKAATYTLAGAGTYFSATSKLEGATATFAVKNLFASTAQHVVLTTPASPAWNFQVSGEGSAHLPGGQASIIQATIRPVADASGWVAPASFNLTSDVGGRVGFVVAVVGGAVTILPEGSSAAPGRLAGDVGKAPAAGLMGAILGLLLVAAYLGRRDP